MRFPLYPAPGSEINRKTAEPMSPFVMFARRHRDRGRPLKSYLYSFIREHANTL
jgi:hypothetical protein